jgi:hypothetical protein
MSQPDILSSKAGTGVHPETFFDFNAGKGHRQKYLWRMP